MKYQQLKPGPAAGRFVECYWVLEDDSPALSGIQRIIPDGRPEIILNLGQPCESLHDGQWKRQPERFFAGQITGPMLVRATGPMRILGIRFRPFGANWLLRSPLHELTDRVIPVDDLPSRLLRQLHRLEYPAAASPAQVLDGILEGAEPPGRGDRRVAAAVDEFIGACGEIDVKQVASQVGWSARQLERRFKDEIGMGPKLFCRIQRFQRVFQAMELPRSNWVDTALRCGYYDQAHLIRDFRDLAGETPTALLDGETDLAAHFLQHGSMSHFSKTSGSR